MFVKSMFMLALVALPAAGHAAGLSLEIEELATQQGKVLVAVMDSAEGWAGKAKPVAVATGAPDGDATLAIELGDLPPGRYAVRVLHDENGNGRLDTNVLGMPTEGYGFSNNPRVLMRAATFEEAAFDLAGDGAVLRIEMR